MLRPLTARPRLEVLEDRVVPALVNHGGAVLGAVQAQAVYLGNWSAAPIPPGGFDAFLAATVNGTAAAPAAYLAMLANAGFTGVTGAGSSVAGALDAAAVPA